MRCFCQKNLKNRESSYDRQVLGISQAVRQWTLTPPSGVRIPHPQPILNQSVFEPRVRITRYACGHISHPQPILNQSVFEPRVRITRYACGHISHPQPILNQSVFEPRVRITRYACGHISHPQ